MEKRDVRRKPGRAYEKPAFRKLTPEQAKLTLFGHAMLNRQEAKDLLEVLFAKPTPDAAIWKPQGPS